MTLAGAIAALVAGMLVAQVDRLEIPGFEPSLFEFIVIGAITGGLAVAASKLRDRGYLPLILLLLLPTLGCTIKGAIYQDTARSVLSFEGTGGDTFCFEGVALPYDTVRVGAVAWGEHECSSIPPQPGD
jgi:hypothetical protein